VLGGAILESFARRARPVNVASAGDFRRSRAT